EPITRIGTKRRNSNSSCAASDLNGTFDFESNVISASTPDHLNVAESSIATTTSGDELHQASMTSGLAKIIAKRSLNATPDRKGNKDQLTTCKTGPTARNWIPRDQIEALDANYFNIPKPDQPSRF